MNNDQIPNNFQKLYKKVDNNIEAATRMSAEITSTLVGLACSGGSFRSSGLKMSDTPWYGSPDDITSTTMLKTL